MSIWQYINAIIDPCMAVFCAGAAIYSVVKRRENDNKASWLMFASLMAGMVFNVSETLAYFFRGDESELGFTMVRVSNFVAFVSIYVLIIFETRYLWRRTEIRGGSESKYLKLAGIGTCVIGIVLMIISRFFDFYYTFDEHNVYVRGDYFWVHLMLLNLSVLPLLIQTLRNRRLYHRREFRAYLCLSLLPEGSMLFQQLTPMEFSMFSIAVSVSILIVFEVYRRETSEFSRIQQSMKFSNANIDIASENVDDFLTALDIERRNRTRLRLIVEEILLRMRNKFGADGTFDLIAIITFGRPQIRIEKKGELFNPLQKTDDDLEELGGALLTQIGINPLFNYSDGRNIVKIMLPRRQMNPALKMIIAMMIGMIAGYLGITKLSDVDQVMIAKDILDPLYEMTTNMFYCATGPILFFMVVTVVLNAAEISDQGGNSLSIMLRYFVLSVLMGVLTLLISQFGIGGGMEVLTFGKDSFSTVLKGLLSIVPADIFTPFVEANTPQLMLIAGVVSLAVLATGSKAKGLVSGFNQINQVCMKMAEWIGRIIPSLTIVMVTILIFNNHIREMMYMFPVMLVSVLITLLFMVVVLIYTRIRRGVRISVLIKKCRQSFMTALRTGYLDSSYGQSEHCCSNLLGVDRNFTKAGLNLGLVMYMPSNVIGTVLFLIYATAFSKVSVSPLWMIFSVLLAVVLFVATPPIPGANILAYIAMISMLNINNEFLMIALMYEIMYGVFASAANQFFVQIELINQSAGIGLLDEEELRAST